RGHDPWGAHVKAGPARPPPPTMPRGRPSRPRVRVVDGRPHEFPCGEPSTTTPRNRGTRYERSSALLEPPAPLRAARTASTRATSTPTPAKTAQLNARPRLVSGESTSVGGSSPVARVHAKVRALRVANSAAKPAAKPMSAGASSPPSFLAIRIVHRFPRTLRVVRGRTVCVSNPVTGGGHGAAGE